MPSDFHPILLVLGNKGDLITFADLLAAFSQTGETVVLNKQGISSGDTTVQLLQQEGHKPGLWQREAGSADLVWYLPLDVAAHFADEVAKLAHGKSLAGSAHLECEVLNEIRVHVSLGEFEDEFLVEDIA